MARRQPTTTQNNFEEFDEDAAPKALQQTRIVTTFTKEVPIDSAADVESAAEDDDPATEAPAAHADEDDPIVALLREMGTGQELWTLVVQRLPTFEKDGRYDLRTKYVGCGKLPLTEDSLRSGDYETEIQSRWARPGKANHFRLQVRRGNRIFGFLPVLSLEPAEPDIIAKQEASEPQIYALQSPAPAETFSSFIKQMKQFSELRDLFIGQSPAPATAQNAAPITTETALLHLVAADESIVESVTEKLGKLIRRADNGAREIGLIDLAMEALKNDTFPKMIRAARELFQEVANVQAPMGAPQVSPMPHYQDPGAQGGLQQGSAQSTQGGVALHSETPPAAPPEIALLQFAVNGCAQNMPAPGAAAWVIEFEGQHPSTTPFITAFLAMPPADALAWLAQTIPQAAQIADLPHAAKWIEELQMALKQGDEGADDGQ